MSHRIQRVNELIQQQLALLIQREFGVDLGFLTISGVNTSSDLQSAQVYVSIFNQDQAKEILTKLQHKAHFFQQQLAKKLTIKYIPKLEFISDHGQDKINTVEELLRQIARE